MNSTETDLLIVGCGYLGRRAAVAWLERGQRVAALTRSKQSEIAALGLEPIVGDVLDRASLAALPTARTLLYAVGLDRTANRTMHEVYVRGLENVLAASLAERIVYISSTGVYAQTDGEWVDETSPTEPMEESGRIVLEAEAMLLALRPDAIRLRFAGIYGPDRLLNRRAIEAGSVLAGDPAKWLNLIHVDDGATAILAAERLANPGELFNVADDQPATRQDYYTLLAKLLNAPAPRFDAASPSERATHRRIGNAKLKARLRIALSHPGYASGLPASIPGAPAAAASASGS